MCDLSPGAKLSIVSTTASPNASRFESFQPPFRLYGAYCTNTDITCFPGGAIPGSIIERAYDDAKYGEFSRRPYMDIVFPSMVDPGMAPPGKHRTWRRRRRARRRQRSG